MPTTVNSALFDAANRHQIFLVRFGGGAARKTLRLLAKAEADAVKLLEARIERLGPLAKQAAGQGGVTSRRLNALIKDLRAQSLDLQQALVLQTSKDLREIAQLELDLVDRRINEAVGVDLNNLRPPPEVVRSLVSSGTMRGRTLRQWYTKLSSERLSRLEAAIKLGIVEGETTRQIVSRFRQSSTASRIQAEALVRTSVNHVGNAARGLMYSANSDVIAKLQWTSTLDGKTSAICSARDGLLFPVGSGPRPPAHPNCRSMMVPITKSWDQLAKKGAFKKARGGGGNIDALFAQELALRGFSPSEAATIKRATRSSMRGDVPASMTYQEWLATQPAKFQDNVLGKVKGQLFRNGDVKLDKFVDMKTGRPFNIAKLRKTESEAFSKINAPAPIPPAPEPAPPPKPPKPVKEKAGAFTEAEQKILDQEGRDFVLEVGRISGKENNFTYDIATGHRWKKMKGRRKAHAPIAESQREAGLDPTRRMIIHHNHPNSSSLSDADLRYINFYRGYKKIFAHGHDGGKFVAEIAPLGKEIPNYIFDGVSKTAQRRAVTLMKKAFADGEISRDYYNAFYSHLFNRGMHLAGLTTYEFEFTAAKKALLSANPAATKKIEERIAAGIRSHLRVNGVSVK